MTGLRRLALLAGACTLAACATTRVETSGTVLREPLCGVGGKPLSALVYWGPQWRPDQKEPPLREAAALRGIREFFGGLTCLSAVEIRRIPGEPDAGIPADEQLLRQAGAASPAPDRVVLIVVRELGPRLFIGIPVVVEGGTEVVIDVRVLDVKAGAALAGTRVHWENGGTMVVKGVKSLDQDMAAALRVALAGRDDKGGAP
jgi:hypothetical protein